MKVQFYLDKENELFCKGVSERLGISVNQVAKLLYTQGRDVLSFFVAESNEQSKREMEKGLSEEEKERAKKLYKELVKKRSDQREPKSEDPANTKGE